MAQIPYGLEHSKDPLMTQQLHLLALVGSLRAASVNRAVMASARTLLPPGATMDEVAIDEVPMYNGDLEDAGDPGAVAALKRAVFDADGLVIFTPEYNISVPAVVKNAIDWLSRPYGAGPIRTVAVGVVAASPGGRAGVGVRTHLSDILRIICPGFHPETLGIGGVHDALEDGHLVGDAASELEHWLDGFVGHARGVAALAEDGDSG